MCVCVCVGTKEPTGSAPFRFVAILALVSHGGIGDFTRRRCSSELRGSWSLIPRDNCGSVREQSPLHSTLSPVRRMLFSYCESPRIQRQTEAKYGSESPFSLLFLFLFFFFLSKSHIIREFPSGNENCPWDRDYRRISRTKDALGERNSRLPSLDENDMRKFDGF